MRATAGPARLLERTCGGDFPVMSKSQYELAYAIHMNDLTLVGGREGAGRLSGNEVCYLPAMAGALSWATPSNYH